MRTALYLIPVLFAAVALATPAFAQTTTEDYTPPRITIFGDPNPKVTVTEFTNFLNENKSRCVVEALTVEYTGITRSLKDVRDDAFVMCMAGAFAHLGFSVIEDAPSERLAGT